MANYKTFKELVGQQQLLKNIPLGSARDDGQEGVATRQGIGARPNLQNTLDIREEPNLFERTLQYMQRASDDFNAVRNAVAGDPEQEDTRRFELPPQTMELRPLEEVLRQPTQTELAFGVTQRMPERAVSRVTPGFNNAAPEYPSSETLADEYARSIFPDNPEAAAALSATIRKEGMTSRSEDVSAYSWGNITNPESDAGWLQPSIENSSRPWAMKRTHQLYRLYGGEPVVDENGNTVPLTRQPTTDELKAIQERLKDAGLYEGSIDGAFGPMSMAALNRWREQNDMPPVESLDAESLQALGVDTVLKDHEGNPMIQYSRPSRPTTPPGEQVVDITYNPYYRANGYEDVMGDVLREGANTPGAGTWRGRGPVQITNRDNYEAIAPFVLEKTGVDIMENPDAVAENDAVAYWATVAHLERTGFGTRGSAEDWIRSINPQASTLNTRMDLYRQLLPSMQSNQ